MSGHRRQSGFRRSHGVFIAVVVVAILASATAFAARDDLLLASAQSASDGGVGGDDNSYTKYSGPSISADGRYIAFGSDADNLSTADNNAFTNVFVRDFQTQTTILVSRRSAADGGAGADGSSQNASISADGRYVAFESGADNLSPDDNNTYTNVFVRDLQTDTTTLVSRQNAADGAAGGDDSSYTTAISPDGRYVAFGSNADNLSTADNNGVANIFLRDLQTNTTTLVTRQSDADGGAGADGSSYNASISAGGRFVSFDSQAANLSAENNDTFGNIYVRDMTANTTTLVSRASGPSGAVSDAESDSTSISADGRTVAFESSAGNLAPGDTNTTDDIYVRNMDTGAVTRASGGTGTSSDWSYGPQISRDGRFVTFYGQADDLSPDDNNTNQNVFVRDLQTGTLTLISRQAGATGSGGDDNSSDPSVSDDGRFVAFHSDADNLSSADNNGFSNVFRREFRSPPINTAAPSISGTAVTGQTVTCSQGTWDNSPTSFAFQWNRDGVAIAGATGSTYVVVAGDVGHQVTCVVTATNGDGSASATSAAVTPVAPPPPVIVPPLITPPLLPVITVVGRASARAVGKSIVITSGQRVFCPAGTIPCKVSVTATARLRASLARFGARTRKLVVGKRTFTVLPGKTVKVTFKLTKKGAKALRVLKTLKMSVKVVARRGTGTPVTATRAIKVKAPKKR